MTKPLLFVCLLAACASDTIDSDEQARRAYLGLDGSVEKALALGFAGFNAANSANIPQQSDTGEAAGTLVVNGQVDQGSSANKGMRLVTDLTGYDDGPIVVNADGDTVDISYDTDPAALPSLTLSLKGIPTGTLEGTLIGRYHLGGDLDGDVTLDLELAGHLADGGGGTVIRAPGTTAITGTATHDDGVYQVDVSL